MYCAKALCYHIVCHHLCVCVVVASSRFLFLQKLKNFGIRRIYKNDGWSCKKKILRFFGTWPWQLLGDSEGYKNTTLPKIWYTARGVPKNTFFQHMLLSMHIEPTYSKITFWGPAHTPHVQFSKKSKKWCNISKKEWHFLFYFRVTSAKICSPKIQKCRNTSFCS